MFDDIIAFLKAVQEALKTAFETGDIKIAFEKLQEVIKLDVFQ